MGKAFQRQQQERTHTRNFNFYYVKMYNKNLSRSTNLLLSPFSAAAWYAITQKCGNVTNRPLLG